VKGVWGLGGGWVHGDVYSVKLHFDTEDECLVGKAGEIFVWIMNEYKH
jgi:hypothetical protein